MSKSPTLALPAHRLLAQSLKSLFRKHSMDRVFRDWLECSAIAVSNSVDLARFKEREARYMQIIKDYDADELKLFCQMLGQLTLALEQSDGECVFGKLVAELEIVSGRGAKWFGQFFSPWAVSSMMARMILHPKEEIEKTIADKGFITMMEPACGAGGMVLACAQALRDMDINYQKLAHFTAVDIDAMCVHMTYLQMSLLGLPGIVVHGNSLTMDVRGEWFTPFHVLGGWSHRLRRMNSQGRIALDGADVAIEPARGGPITVADIDEIQARAKATAQLITLATSIAEPLPLPPWTPPVTELIWPALRA